MTNPLLLVYLPYAAIAVTHEVITSVGAVELLATKLGTLLLLLGFAHLLNLVVLHRIRSGGIQRAAI